MPTISSIFSDEIIKQANSVREAENQYERDFDAWARGVPTLDPEHFWPEVERLRRVSDTRDNNPERTVEEYFREAHCKGEEALAKAVHFAVSYRRYCTALSNACNDVVEGWGRGDDSFGDLMDSLPLAGREVFERLRNGDFFDEDEDGDDVVNLEELETAVRVAVPKIVERILHGENYWATTLEDEARRRMKFILCLRGEGEV